MLVEISIALQFIVSYLYNKLPRRRVDMFLEELDRGLKKKFEGHWYPETPMRGSAFRCLRVTGEKIDPVVEMAAESSGAGIGEIFEFLPKDLIVWIDPFEVSYKIGEKGMTNVLYSNKNDKIAAAAVGVAVSVQAESNKSLAPPTQQQATNGERESPSDGQVKGSSGGVGRAGFNPDAECFRPISVCLSSSMNSLSLSPSPIGSSPWATVASVGGTSPINSGSRSLSAYGSNAANSSASSLCFESLAPSNNFNISSINNNNSNNNSNILNANSPAGNRQIFTAAMFAQTKFGSTKLKSPAKRPTRLSPTELALVRQRQAYQQLPGGGAWSPNSSSSSMIGSGSGPFSVGMQYSGGGCSPRAISPGVGEFHHLDYLHQQRDHQQRIRFLHQQQQQFHHQQHHSVASDFLSPGFSAAQHLGGSVNDLGFVGSGGGAGASRAITGGMLPQSPVPPPPLSPDLNKDLLDMLGYNAMVRSQPNLDRLLVS